MWWKTAKVLGGGLLWVAGLACVVLACGGLMTGRPFMAAVGSLGALSCWNTFLSILD